MLIHNLRVYCFVLFHVFSHTEELTSKLWIMNELAVVGFVHLLFVVIMLLFLLLLMLLSLLQLLAWSTLSLVLISHFSDLEPANKKRETPTTNIVHWMNWTIFFSLHNPQHFTLCKFDLQDSMLHENCLHTFGWVQTHHHNCHEQFTFVL